MMISCKNDWDGIDVNLVVEIVVSDNCCQEGVRVVDLSGCVSLRELRMGRNCFEMTEELKLIGLNELERVVIGNGCFTMHGYNTADGMNPNHHFHLKNCERLKELKIGCYAFMDYSVCEIENVPSLEVIEMGEVNEVSRNFSYASLELKSDCKRMK